MKFIKDLDMRKPKPTSKRAYRYALYECPTCKRPFEINKYSKSKNCMECSLKILNGKPIKETFFREEYLVKNNNRNIDDKKINSITINIFNKPSIFYNIKKGK